jgi:hypothetical protein
MEGGRIKPENIDMKQLFLTNKIIWLGGLMKRDRVSVFLELEKYLIKHSGSLIEVKGMYQHQIDNGDIYICEFGITGKLSAVSLPPQTEF